MLKLYGGARSRASIVQWYLEELEIPYEFVLLDMSVQEHLQPEFRQINPFGKVPAIDDGGFSLWESGAILLYLAQKYSKEFDSPETQGTIAQWILFANATLGPGVFVEASREREFPRLMQPLDELFGQQPFVLDDRFTVADVAIGSMLSYIPLMLKLDFGAYPNVVNYVQRLSERPAFVKTIGGRR
ncbi:glutathione S-transferase family protein [Phormidesmis sp. 146-33]